MNFIELDNKELQEVFEQLIRAINDLETSESLTQFERDEKAKIVRRLNRRYEVLNNRAQYNRIMEMKLENKSRFKRVLEGLVIGVLIGLLWFITITVLVN